MLISSLSAAAAFEEALGFASGAVLLAVVSFFSSDSLTTAGAAAGFDGGAAKME